VYDYIIYIYIIILAFQNNGDVSLDNSQIISHGSGCYYHLIICIKHYRMPHTNTHTHARTHAMFLRKTATSRLL